MFGGASLSVFYPRYSAIVCGPNLRVFNRRFRRVRGWGNALPVGHEQSRTWFTHRKSFSIRVDLRHQRFTWKQLMLNPAGSPPRHRGHRARHGTRNANHGKDLQGIQLFPFRVVFRGSFPPCPLFLRGELGCRPARRPRGMTQKCEGIRGSAMRCVPKRFLSAFFCDGLRAKPPGFEPPISPSARMGKCLARGGSSPEPGSPIENHSQSA